MLSALVVSGWLSAVMAGGGGGHLGYHTRNEAGMTGAPYLEWANPAIDLPAAFPAFVPQPVQPDPGGLVSRRIAARSGFLVTLPWILCLGGAAFVVSRINRRATSPEALTASAAVTFACAVMAATSIGWKITAAPPVTVPAAQMDALRRIASGHVAVFGLTSHRRLHVGDAGTMAIAVSVRRARRGGPRGLNPPLAAYSGVPAGTYLLSTTRHGVGDGLLIVGVGADQFAIVTQPLAAFDAGVRIRLPVGARVLTVRGDEIARDLVGQIELHPIALEVAPSTRDLARRAVRYEGAVAFFVDDRAFPEPSGFWVGRARETSVVLAPDEGRGAVALMLRNGPVENTVTLEVGDKRDALVMKPGEERRVQMPDGAVFLRIRSAAGFRPSEVDPGSRDTRLLGVYVRLVER